MNGETPETSPLPPPLQQLASREGLAMLTKNDLDRYEARLKAEAAALLKRLRDRG